MPEPVNLKLIELVESQREIIAAWKAAENHADLTEFIVRDLHDYEGVGIRERLREARKTLSTIREHVKIEQEKK